MAHSVANRLKRIYHSAKLNYLVTVKNMYANMRIRALVNKSNILVYVSTFPYFTFPEYFSLCLVQSQPVGTIAVTFAARYAVLCGIFFGFRRLWGQKNIDLSVLE